MAMVCVQPTGSDDTSSKASPVLQPAEKAGEDEQLPPPSSNKELHCLKIPLNDSGSAGLGVSVKGKTTSSEHGSSDLGIFIKSVITGGAAHKVMHLHWTHFVMLLVTKKYQ